MGSTGCGKTTLLEILCGLRQPNSGRVLLDGVEQPVSKGSLVHIPPGVVHGARGQMRVLVVGIPDIAEDDYFEVGEV
jgi:ABC-type taurine transport system ATPase subunit